MNSTIPSLRPEAVERHRTQLIASAVHLLRSWPEVEASKIVHPLLKADLLPILARTSPTEVVRCLVNRQGEIRKTTRTAIRRTLKGVGIGGFGCDVLAVAMLDAPSYTVERARDHA